MCGCGANEACTPTKISKKGVVWSEKLRVKRFLFVKTEKSLTFALLNGSVAQLDRATAF